jgi:glycine/D-amino acid oxidase-like deaminating enzyme
LELEQRRGMYLIHNYGHGGSGWTVSWGCARYVLEILTKIQVQQIDEIEFVDSNQIIY